MTEISQETAFLDHLQSESILSADAARRARGAQLESKQGLCAVLVSLGILAEDDLIGHLVTFLDLPIADLPEPDDIPELLSRINAPFLRRAQVIPFEETESAVKLATADPFEVQSIQAIGAFANKPVELYLAPASRIAQLLNALLPEAEEDTSSISGDGNATTGDIQRLMDLASEAPVIRLVNSLISEAIEARASDIHIEPMEDRLDVRYRVDGALRKVTSRPTSNAAAVTSRIKIMAHLDIAERRMPQDGRLRFAVKGREVDFRISTTPAQFGESVVLRILDRSALELDYDALGFSTALLERWQKLLQQPHGILLVTGPTGSGKTTTLYASLSELNTPDRKILTIEDPVEYLLDGINQVQVNPDIDLTFASALRSFLRQDPDILMVGEMRDLETAQTAVQAALTGHLVLSTLHTNDAVSTLTRLLDMGIERFLIAATVRGILAQRLVRRLCTDCRTTREIEPALLDRYPFARLAGSDVPQLFTSEGCESCQGSGYKGRLAIFELVTMSGELLKLVEAGADEAEVRVFLQEAQVDGLLEDGLRKCLSGETSLEEVLRVSQLAME